MTTAICTISSLSHLFKVNALFASLKGKTAADFHCLMTDFFQPETGLQDIQYHSIDSLNTEDAKKIRKKYKGNQLRWGCKSLLIEKLLQEGYDAVIYVDNDIFFYSSPDFLFDQLQTSSILLTPHYYPANPEKDQNWLEANYRVGLFNGGFIGANQTALPAMNWWAKCCIYNIKKSYWRGLFDDQKYLDLLPVMFENVEILPQKGCNVAGWNLLTSPRSINPDGELVLDGKWPLVFVHYNYYTIDCILQKKDPLLEYKWLEYLNMLTTYFPSYNPKTEKQSFISLFLQYFQYIRYRLARVLE